MNEPLRRWLTKEQARALVRLARRQLECCYGVSRDGFPELRLETELNAAGVFATLRSGGDLRGCVGYLDSGIDVVQATKRAVIAAAREDPRFERVKKEELARIRIGISILSPPERLAHVREIVIGRDGLIVERAGLRGLLLPQVAEDRKWEPERFLSETCHKAGLPRESWKEPETTVLRFEAVHYDEELA